MGEAGGGRVAFGADTYFGFFADKDSLISHTGCVKIEMLSFSNTDRRMV
jgi:hypothetical protein